MAKLTRDEVLNVAKLARLTLSEEEANTFIGQLSEVINYVNELNEVDTEGIEPTSQTTGLTDILSVDEIDAENILSVEDAASGTDRIHNNYFVVPPLIQKDEE